MMGLIFSIIAGALMSIQGVFNTRLGEKIGLVETNVLVQATGLIFTFLIWLFYKTGSFKNLKNCNKLYLLGGLLGVIIIYTVMRGMKTLGPTYAVSTILISQLATAGLIDALGLFGTEKVPFGMTKIIGLIIMVVGIIIFKIKG